MLSQDLAGMASKFHDYQDSGMQIAPEAVVEFVDILIDMTERARALELAQIAPTARIVDLPDNVVRLATALHRQGVRVGPRPICEPDGAA